MCINNPHRKTFIDTIITGTNMDKNYLHDCNVAVVSLEPKDLSQALTMKPGPSFEYPRKDLMLFEFWSLPKKTFGYPCCNVVREHIRFMTSGGRRESVVIWQSYH